MRCNFAMAAWVAAGISWLGCSASNDASDRDANAEATGDPASVFGPTRDWGSVGGSVASAGHGNAAVFPSVGSSASPNGAQYSPGVGGAGSFSAEREAGVKDQPVTGDAYQAVGTNSFVIAAHDPLSTFAADVDTASYDLFRRDVNLGVLPAAASVRLEEYVNAFPYDYPAPTESDEHPFAIALGAAPHLLSRGTTLLRVGIQAQLPEDFAKKPANLVFLVDTSGSMSSQNKLPLVQYTLTQTLEMLDPTDTVSIVTYAGQTSIRLKPTQISEYDTIHAAITGLVSAGSTAGASGIQLAYQQAEAGMIPGGINHVILCTDGDFNVGISSTEGLVDLITEKRKSGITLTVLGYGSGNLNDAMMEAISNKGNGIYAMLSSQEHASRYVRERMLSTLQHVAKDMKIQVEFNPSHVYAYRLLGYENRAIADQDFRNDLVDAGEVGAGHRVTALYEVVPQGGTIPNASEAPEVEDGAAFEGAPEASAEDLVMVKVRYKSVDATETDPAFEVSASLAPSQILSVFSAADLDLQWALAIAAYAEILKQSPYADSGHLEVIGNVARAQAHRDEDRAEFARLFQTALPRVKARP